MALATEHMESKNRWNYRTFNSLDTICKEILMKFAYDKSKAQRIINYEDIMLKTYSKIISTYTSLFEQYDCSLKVRLFWIDFSTERRSNRRLPFRIGYACYVCCEVQRDGKEVQVKSADGEADYYSLSATWMVSSIEYAIVYTGTTEIKWDDKTTETIYTDVGFSGYALLTLAYFLTSGEPAQAAETFPQPVPAQ